MCVACRGHDAKRGLYRIVRDSGGEVVFDPTGKRDGRGAYLCDNPACWERALAGGILARALKTDIDARTAADLRQFAQTLPPSKAGATRDGAEE
ncbi:MAG: YlxR family protein [Thermomicrobiales bacterium]|nr:YlxR family protein [Thermomicrobiales bacterium]